MPIPFYLVSDGWARRPYVAVRRRHGLPGQAWGRLLHAAAAAAPAASTAAAAAAAAATTTAAGEQRGVCHLRIGDVISSQWLSLVAGRGRAEQVMTACGQVGSARAAL